MNGAPFRPGPNDYSYCSRWFGGVPELRGDASVPGPDTGKSHKFRSYLRVLIDAFHSENESFLWGKMVNDMKWQEMKWVEMKAMVVAILYMRIDWLIYSSIV